jgi:hypothetical protein
MNEPQSPQPQPPSQPPSDRVGMVGEIANIIKSLSLTNVLIIALLVGLAIPSYILWRFLNDASLLNKFTSFYEELSSDKVGCTLRIASQRGAYPIYSISTGFAFQGSDRYTVAVLLTHQPDEGELVSYCEVLNKIVDHMRRPEQTKSPTFPNSDEPLIWRYPPVAQP